MFLLAVPEDLLPDDLPPAVYDFFDAPLEGDLLAAVVLPLVPLFEPVLPLELVLLFDLAAVFGEVPLLAEPADRLLPDALLPELFAVPAFDGPFFPPVTDLAGPPVLLREAAEPPDFEPFALELDLLAVFPPAAFGPSLVAISAALDAAPIRAPVAAPLTSSATTFLARSIMLSIVPPCVEVRFFDSDRRDSDPCDCLAILILPCSNLMRSLSRYQSNGNDRAIQSDLYSACWVIVKIAGK